MTWEDIIKFGDKRPSFSTRRSSSVPLRDKIKQQLGDSLSPQGEEDQCCEYVKDLYNKRLYKRYEEALEMVKGMSLTPERQKEIDAKLKDLKLSSDDHKEIMMNTSCEDFRLHLKNEKGDTLSEELFDITGLLREWEECKERMS